MNAADQRLVALLERVEAREPRLLDGLYDRHGIIRGGSAATLVRALRLDGSNTLASLVRGEGIGYDVLVHGVARRLKLDAPEGSDERLLEQAVLDAVLGRLFDTLTPAQRAEALRRAPRAATRDLARPQESPRWVPGQLEIMVRDVGTDEVGYVVQQIVVRALGYGVAREAAKRLAGGVGLAVPLVNVAMIGWTVWDLAGPAFRKTMPSVVEIALLRLQFPARRLTPGVR